MKTLCIAPKQQRQQQQQQQQNFHAKRCVFTAPDAHSDYM